MGRKWERSIFSLAMLLGLVLGGCGGGDDGSVAAVPSNYAPGAFAGHDLELTTGIDVQLNGNGSFDRDGDTLTFLWAFISLPAGSAAVISDPTIADPTFTADVEGTYIVSLVVNDGTVDSVPDTLVVTAFHPVQRPDTGQSTCYDAAGTVVNCVGTGQDGAYTINSMNFTNNGNGTVVDNVTGLMWQQQDDKTARVLTDLQAYCENLDLGGYSDWRLPASKELIDLVDYSRYNPAIDGIIFPNTQYYPSPPYLSSTLRISYTGGDAVWGVYAGEGQDSPFTTTVEGLARCVRNGSYSPQTLVDNGDGTVTDYATGLVWQQDDDQTARTWQGSLVYCEELVLAGRDDWRLPNIKELRSLALDTRWGPALDTAYFAVLDRTRFWSSTTYAMTPSWAWATEFRVGGIIESSKTLSNYARCVSTAP